MGVCAVMWMWVYADVRARVCVGVHASDCVHAWMGVCEGVSGCACGCVKECTNVL